MHIKPLLLLSVLVAVVGCSSGNGQNCETDNGTGLSASDWPKFRKDLGNTGQIDATIAATQTESWVFPPRDQAPFSSAATSPVILDDGRILVLANQGTFVTVIRAFLIDPNTGAESGSFNITLGSVAAVNQGSTPVITQNRIAAMFADGVARQFEFDGKPINGLAANGFVTGSLTVGHDGTLYTATTAGLYSSLCASGGDRWVLGVGGTESTAALFEGDATTDKDDLNIVASNDGKVRAFRFKGDAVWTFTATAAVRASVIYDTSNTDDPSDDLVYGVDSSGLVFVLKAPDGRRCRNLTFNIGAPVVASPTFADAAKYGLPHDMLYVVDRIGVVHALSLEAACNPAESAPKMNENWTYATRASVSSSPAVASSPTGEPVIVFGSDDGTVHAIVDHGTSGDVLWDHCTQERGAFNQSSPAVDGNGGVYVTTTAGRLYAIKAGNGTSAPCFPPSDSTPTVSPAASPTPSPTPIAQP